MYYTPKEVADMATGTGNYLNVISNPPYLVTGATACKRSIKIMKPWYLSKTFWFNALYLVLGVATYFGWLDFKPDTNTIELASVVVAVINIILRYVTTVPITLKG